MKKRLFIFSILLIMITILTGCTKNSEKTDAIKFKEEYESLNDKENANGAKHRTVSIDKENPFIYKSAEDIVKMIENKETFYVYFGDSQCPWCRSVIEKMIEVSKDFEISKIYYVKIWDDDHNEILRDTYTLTGDEAVKTKDGTESYYKLLNYFDNVLKTYTLTSSDGNKIELQEKRIYAPNVIYIKNGVASVLTEGISDKQAGSRDELTEEILKDEEKLFEEFFETSTTCIEEIGC